MNVNLSQPIDPGHVPQDGNEVEKYYLDQLMSPIRNLAEQKAQRGLCFVDNKAIVPADLWVVGKLFCISTQSFDEFCSSEESAQIV